ncbi:hypothetical protein [Microbacterium gilvum]|uniref:DUF1049 domain-containing protein n=1 Tax=Microbacterium gilvum TaxID=1336204 RepID=A0ABP9AEQ5_9MICO
MSSTPHPAAGDETAVAAAPEPGAAPTVAEQPRTRWAAIVWGVALAIAAALGLGQTVDPSRFTTLQDGVVEWTLAADPLSVSLAVVLALGAAVLVAGLAGIARGVQRRVAARR